MSGRQERGAIPDERRVKILRQMVRDGHSVAEIKTRLQVSEAHLYALAKEQGLRIGRGA